ncbi:hypothetical protein BDV96DRAFT_579315 [Lophiotrema nucula]|uniref:DUF4211 domain-containing protein n=1 Tax=Lophiotrema nucula TaxID=690887 RepID=A0A6A5Z3A9_9PLEO|nr:hypothetical protein BDV96DRAFT_579315 [Lophiotrema nucula]
MAPKRMSQRKRQSKLAFSPVPASSSGASMLSPQVRARAAAVALEGSPGRPQKKRKLDFGIVRGTRESSDSDSDIPLDRSHGLPTPNKSFHTGPDSARKRAEEKSMGEGMPILSRKNGMFGSSDNEHFDSSSSSSDTGDPQRQPIDLTPKKKGKKRGKDSKGAKPEQQKSTRSKTGGKRKIVSESESEELEELSTMRSTRSSERKEKRTKSSKANTLPTHRKKAPAIEVLSDSGDSDTMPDTSPPPRRGRRPAKRQERADSFEVPDDVVEVEESEDDDVAPRSTQKRRNVQDISDDDDDEEESEEEAPRSTARRLMRKKGSGRDRQEEEDLNADLDFLQSSPPADKGRLRSTNAKPLNERQKALETLKKRRSQAEPSSSALSRGPRPVVPPDSDSELEIIQKEKEVSIQDPEEEKSDEIEDDSVVEEEPQGPRALEVFYENENDADFIDDNDEGLLGEPADLSSIPLEFTSLSRSKTKDLFKYAVEWMVQKKINPAFSSTDDIYDLTFRKLNDEVNTLANSKYSSSAWTVDFTRALRARPEIMIDEISRSERMVMEPHCEACNRKTHPATFNIHLSGKPYNKESLEPLADDDSDSDSSDSDSAISSTGSATRLNNEPPTYDAQGELIPPESRTFTLGSTCKANAQMAHTLHHWRFHLNSWVVDYLARAGHCTPQKLVERDRWSENKRRKYANRVVDDMEQVGEIRKLYRLYKEQVDFALEASNEYKSGWGRRG